MKKNKELIDNATPDASGRFWRMSSGKEVRELLEELSPLVASSVEVNRVEHGNISIKLSVYYTLHESELDDSGQEG